MTTALSKTISLFLLILVGFLLRKKIVTKDQKSGIKSVILSVALPAMIFIGLQKISFTWDMLAFPLVALLFNLIAFFFTSLPGNLFKFNHGPAKMRTLKMLFPSLAPGLSCFPFLLEYFGEESLANAAIADIGNKIFVLMVLYMIALKWHYSSKDTPQGSSAGKLNALMRSLIKEPVNLVILMAVFLLALGIKYQNFPDFLKLTIDRLSLIMTPLILIFIGISVKLQWQQAKAIFSLLISRSAFAFLFSAVILLVTKPSDPILAMLVVLFPQSSCSFWPYAHMCAINKMDEAKEKDTTFDLDLGMNVLALSLPFSTIMILSLSVYGEGIAEPGFVFSLALLLFGLALLPVVFSMVKKVYIPTSSLAEVEEN